MCCGRSRPKRSRTKTRSRFKRVVPQDQISALSIEAPPVNFLLCRPDFYGIDYSINPWMDVNNKADKNKVVEQWNSLESKIKELGGTVQLVKPVEGLPDMVFTANAALILKDGKVIVSTFFHKERQKETEYFDEWFLDNGHVIYHNILPFEGAGDALYIGDMLIGGYGFRSDLAVYSIPCFSPVTVVKLVNPYFYHLDTCFCPLDDLDYMIYPGAFDDAGLQSIRSLGGNEISVPEDEAKLFACNAVQINKNIILPAGCPETMKLLQEKGYQPHPLEMSEFIKSGGACKCLTLKL
jgi:N-dimethylarginine dimethylaminohydrolase